MKPQALRARATAAELLLRSTVAHAQHVSPPFARRCRLRDDQQQLEL
jgi:hypothetical protein